MKTGLKILAALVVITIFLYIYLQPNDLLKCQLSSGPDGPSQCSKANAIIAISGGDTSARASHAIFLYKHGWATTLIFSGAAQDKSGPSNAEVMKKMAISQGVPEDAILTDETSNNTEENAKNTELLLERNHIKSFILVTSGYHQRRAFLEFKRMTASKNITIYNSPTNDADWGPFWWASFNGWWLALNEIGKIIVFHVQGIL
jgi:uncharacterized SAM-binding protein YcdF (DUF218 family)